MGKMRSEHDRRDEVLGARLREALEELSGNGEPDFSRIELAAGRRDAMPASGRSRRRPPLRLFLVLPAAAAVALAVGLGWHRLAEVGDAASGVSGVSGVSAVSAGSAGDNGLGGMLPWSPQEASDGDPLGMEVSLLARESVGGDRSLPPSASGPSDSFHEELAVFVADLWADPGALAAVSGDESAEGGY